jgi:putative SOS response-associated peptidase YedK
MCGRYVTPEQAAIERYWHIGRHNWLQHILPLFNVAPTSIVPIILQDADGQLELAAARWGLIPHWWSKDALPTLTFNARSEEAAQKPMWRQGLKSQRCLMPVRGWYEWRETASAVPGGRATKQPYYIHVPGAEVLAFAGLWAQWRKPDGELLRTCALLSRSAADSIAEIHHRMPVVVKPEHFEAWLNPETSAATVQSIIADACSDFTAYPVSTRVNNARNDSPELIQALTP